MEIIRDIDYGGNYGKQSTLDIYMRKNDKGNGCLIIFTHGGLYKDGDKNQYEHLAKFLLENEKLKKIENVAVAIINYPLSSEQNGIKYPKHNKECASSLFWLYNNLESKYGFKIDNIILIGHSCGGTINGLLLYDDSIGVPKEVLSKIKGSFSVSSIFDLQSLTKELPKQFLEDFYISHPKEQIENWACPINKVNKRSNCEWFIYHSKKDPWVELSQAQNFANKLKENDIEFNLVTPEDGGEHYDEIRDKFDQHTHFQSLLVEFILSKAK